MEQELDETVLVENLPGASGASAYQQLIAAEPDGHTLSKDIESLLEAARQNPGEITIGAPVRRTRTRPRLRE